MKIKVNRETVGKCFSGHVYFYAWSECEDDYYSLAGGKTYAIKFDFYDTNKKVIQVVDGPDSYVEDHNSVILTSEQRFEDFCFSIIVSSFNQGSSFDSINKNCVNSVLFALEQANIHLTLDEGIKCKHLIGFFCCPSRIITPRELILLLKDQNNDRPLLKQNTHITEKTALLAADEHKVVGRLEEGAIKYERLATGCALVSLPLCFSTMKINPGIAFFALCVPLAASLFFQRKALSKAQEIKQEYENTYGEMPRAPRGFGIRMLD